MECCLQNGKKWDRMNWNKGFTASYYIGIVDTKTWRDIDRFEVIDGSIKRTDSNLIESADLECTHRLDTETWIRVWLDASQAGSSEHVPLFTGLATSPKINYEGNLATYDLECYSVLKPANDVLLPRGWYATPDIEGTYYIEELLSTLPAPVRFVGNPPRLKDFIIAEDGESNLSMVYKILKAMNWRIRINGYGEIVVCETATEPTIKFDTLENDSITPEFEIEHDWFECPNVFRAVMDDTSAVARDDSEESVLSTVNRGREIWQQETNCDLNDNETIADYALRRLQEEQRNVISVSYDRRFIPDVTVSDVIMLNYPRHNISGLYYITEQTIKLGNGAETSEEVVRA